MLFTSKVRSGGRGKVALALAGAVAAAVALSACGGSSSNGASSSTRSSAPASHAASVGNPPPEWAAHANAWPAHNYDLSNARNTSTSDINATNVSKLKPLWRFKLPYIGEFGAYASNPIVLDGVVYIEDPDSNVYALNQQTGKVMWKHLYKSPTPSGGPNGLALGYGLLFGATEGSAFALDPKTGKQVWKHKLTDNKNEGIDMAPQLYDGKVLISTIPGSSTNFYHPGALGIVYSLKAKTGKTIWKFNTIKGGYKLFGNPKVNSGGGLWYPPSVDGSGRVFMGVANPAPYPGTPKFPNGSSHPGPNLYTDSLVALDGATGKLLWFQQVTPHDFRDYDFQVAPIVRSQMINGTNTEIVIGAGKSGKVVAFRADNGKRLWTRNVGVHKFDSGPFPLKKAVCYEPGFLGGVETPMAASGNLVYVPWVDLCFKATATGIKSAGGLNGGTGGLAAINSATGKVVWKNHLPSPAYGAATVANDVVFTATLAGKIYAYDAQTGKLLWTTTAPAGINAFPAVTKDMLIVGAGAPGNLKKPHYQIVAYSPNAPAGGAKTQTAPSGAKTPAPPASNAASGVSGNAGSSASAKGTTVQVKGGEFFFRLSTKSAAKPGTVTFVFQNIGHVQHDFRINGKQTPLLQPGQTAKLVVAFNKNGSYPYLCTVPGHAEAGMKGVFTVR
jgi:outer membrane protein assembly factor BamB/plastocyanin